MKTNKEHYMDQIIEALCEREACVFIERYVHGSDCTELDCVECVLYAKAWMEQEYKEPSIWDEVPKGTPVWVWKSNQTEDYKQLARFQYVSADGYIMATSGGWTSEWKNARLVKPEDLYLI